MSLPADGGGPGTGPGGLDFRIISQTPNILHQAGGAVVDAVTVTAVETTYNVGYTFTRSLSEWEGAEWSVFAADVASWIGVIAAHDHVIGLYGAQDTDANGFLDDYLFVTVGIDGTDSEAQTRVLLENANTPAAFQKIDNTYSLLVQRQNGG
jgi:hypothetical protein